MWLDTGEERRGGEERKRGEGGREGGTYHVKLAGGEFRVVGEVDALVAELTPDFIHAVQAADDQLLGKGRGGGRGGGREGRVCLMRRRSGTNM